MSFKSKNIFICLYQQQNWYNLRNIDIMLGHEFLSSVSIFKISNEETFCVSTYGLSLLAGLFGLTLSVIRSTKTNSLF